MRQQCMYFLACIFLLLTSVLANAQHTIRGKILDQHAREPLETAVVTDVTTQKNTLTDADGYFTLRQVSINDSLQVSYVGYTTAYLIIRRVDQPFNMLMSKGNVDLAQVTISSHANALISARALTNLDLNMKPARSAQDLLRLVPGLFIAQQVGGGKAEQIFLRGFDADHGTDVNISVDGMPVNLVSQAHGQGWADLHFLIPETMGSYDFGKGPYYSGKGDFTTAGYVSYNTTNALEKNMFKIEGGQFNTGRAVVMMNLLKQKAIEKGQSAYIAGEALYTNGPFDYGQHFKRLNLFGKFITPVGADSKLTLIASYFSSNWRASGEIPNRAMAKGYVPDRFGVIDSSQGGATHRTNLNVKLVSALGNNTNLENQLYYSDYYFNLLTNFTFYLVDPVNGDEFNQHERRDLFGYNGKISHQSFLQNATLTSTGGISFRYDATHPSWLAHSRNHEILNYLQLGKIRESNLNGYLEQTLQTGKWLFDAGLRLDYLHFYYNSTAPDTDSAASIYKGLKKRQGRAILSPKINIQYTANAVLQLYVKAGKGFHSNDARVVIGNEGFQTLPAAYGADLGVNLKPLPRLYLNVALWYIFLQQEFTYGSDYGDESVSPGGKTVRKGIDFSVRYQINNWLYGDANLNFARPRALHAARGDDYLPTAPTFTSTAGLYVRFKNGINGGISYRYLHDRPANQDYSLVAKGYFLTDFVLNYTRRKYEIGLAVENLFNQRWSESQVEYVSRLKYELKPVDEVSYTAGVPFFAKLKCSVFF